MKPGHPRALPAFLRVTRANPCPQKGPRGAKGKSLDTSLIDSKAETSSKNKSRTSPSWLNSTWALKILFSFPDQTCAGCSVLHFHFRRNQPIYRKAQPAPGAARVFTVRAGFLFQKHLSERNRILFSVPALCAAAVRSHQRPSRFPSLQELLGVAGTPGHRAA